MNEHDLSKLELLIELMAKKGVRRVELSGVVVELDPAAQHLNAPEREKGPDVEAQVAAGLCRQPGCDQKNGWLKTQYCKRHFGVALAGRAS